MSVVDVALILGPTRPATLAVQVLDWMTAPDLSLRFTASAGAVLQLLLVLGALAAWILSERLVAARGRVWAAHGARGVGWDRPLRGLVMVPMLMIGLGVGLGLAGLALWSLAGLWRFPDLLPQSYGLRVWADQSAQLWRLSGTTTALAGLSAMIALALTIATLQAGPARTVGIIYLPLLVPQIAFLPGLSALGLWLGLDGTTGAVLLVHLVFVLPYVMLSLSDPWQAWDSRAGLAAATLGAAPWRVLLAVRLPMLMRALCIAFAVGFATSVAQYLPSLLIGAGRVNTLTTEAVALAASGNRRLIGVWAMMQMALPLAGLCAGAGGARADRTPQTRAKGDMSLKLDQLRNCAGWAADGRAGYLCRGRAGADHHGAIRLRQIHGTGCDCGRIAARIPHVGADISERTGCDRTAHTCTPHGAVVSGRCVISPSVGCRQSGLWRAAWSS